MKAPLTSLRRLARRVKAGPGGAGMHAKSRALGNTHRDVEIVGDASACAFSAHPAWQSAASSPHSKDVGTEAEGAKIERLNILVEWL